MTIGAYSLDSGDSCRIAVEFGCNLFSWKPGGVEVLRADPGFYEDNENFYYEGNPILFPSVGRTWDRSGTEPVNDTYRIYLDEKIYTMPIHGIVDLAAWRELDVTEESERVRLSYELIVPDDVLEQCYPFQMGVVQSFELTPGALSFEAVITNRGSRPAPFAFGYHPYFRLTGDGEVTLPCKYQLELVPGLLIPTGGLIETSGILQVGAGKGCDSGFTGLTGRRATLRDDGSGRTVNIDFDENVETLVVYAPEDGSAVCVEPWTRGLGGYEKLREPGWETGEAIPVLTPGESRTIHIRYSVSE